MSTPAASSVAYEIDLREPGSHRVGVTVTVRGHALRHGVMVLPVWTPGSYMIREYSRHVRTAAASDLRGRSLGCRKIRKNAWLVETEGRAFRFSLDIWALDISVRTSYLDADRAAIVPASVLPALEGRAPGPVSLRIRTPRGFGLASGLDGADPAATSVVLKDYDALLDQAFLAGKLQGVDFNAGGRRHRFVFSGDGSPPLRKIARDTRRIIEATKRVFRSLPYTQYTFLCALVADADGQGGLEHRDCSFLQVPRRAFADAARYRSFLGLVAHEYFHLWNVKRIHDSTLGPFDYEAENYTRLLWFHEGFTSYYDDLIPCRAGVFSIDDYLTILGDALTQHAGTPGRLVQTLADASFDAWVKYYRRNEESRSATVSYYQQGALLALTLDLTVRERSGGRRSLDHVMRALDASSRDSRFRLTESSFAEIAGQAAGMDLRGFLRRHVTGTIELPLARALATVGLTIERAGPARPHTGALVRAASGRLMIDEVLAGSSAERAGLCARDEIVAVDSQRVEPDPAQWLASSKPGDTIEVTVFRGDRVVRTQLWIGDDPAPARKVVPDPAAPTRARAQFRAWLERPFPNTQDRAKSRGARGRP